MGNLEIGRDLGQGIYTKAESSLHINTISDLLIVNFTVNHTINVKGYHTINDGGGGIFNWDSTVDKATANGITDIDPSVSLALQGTGIGLGCWVRQYSGAINALWVVQKEMVLPIILLF